MISLEERNEVLDMVKKLSYYFEKTKNSLCEPYKLSSIQSTIILDVFHNEGTKVTDICSRLGKSTNTVSPLINRLVEHGYLTKEKNEDDQRVVGIFLTDKAKGIMGKLMDDIGAFTWPMFDALTDEEFKKVYESLVILANLTYNADKGDK